MNSVAFLVIAIITLSGALAAATLRKLVHAALCLVIAFVGLAAFFFLLGAEFVGLVQVFVYVGAVAVLIVFTILLTRREVNGARGINWGGAIVALAVFGGLLSTILKTKSLAIAMRRARPHRRAHRRACSRDGGEALMAREIIFPGSAGCQPAAFGRRAECIFAKRASIEVPTELIPKDVRGRLPRTTGQRPVVPSERSAP